MKLSLVQEKGFPVLVVSGAIDAHQFQVLKAGITKLLQAGKNRIMIEFVEAKSFPSELLREIAYLNILARELSGNIVLTGIEPATQALIRNYSKPPAMETFPNRAEAIAALSGMKAEDETLVPAAPSTPTAQAAPATVDGTTAASPAPTKTKIEIRDEELNSLGGLRKELERLTRENEELEKRLLQLVLDRREIPNRAGYLERVKMLETELEDALSKIKVEKAAQPKK